MGIQVDGLKCPVCGDAVYQEKYIKNKLYVCAHPLKPIPIREGLTLRPACCHCQSFCEGCEQILDESNFGFNGTVYECKKCGKTNWPLTEYKNEINGIRNNLQKINSKAQNVINKAMNDFNIDKY